MGAKSQAVKYFLKIQNRARDAKGRALIAFLFLNFFSWDSCYHILLGAH